MTPITPQEFYNKTIAHLIEQGHRAVNSEGLCAYRDSDGGRCAAGLHIPDRLYNKAEMEGHSIRRLYRIYLELVPYFPDLQLAYDLQVLHDCEGSWDEEGFTAFRGAAEIARKYNLTPWEQVP